MKLFKKTQKNISISYSFIIKSCENLFFHPSTSTKYFSNSTFTAALRSYQKVKSFQFNIHILDRTNIANNQMLHFLKK